MTTSAFSLFTFPALLAAAAALADPGPQPQAPGELLPRLIERLREAALAYGPAFAVAAAALVILAVAARRIVARVRHDRLSAGARLVEILPPPEVDPPGARALWGQLVGLLRPAWARVLTGQPHVSWEYAWDHTGLAIRLWVPGTVPPGLVEHAVAAAWPGSQTTTREADPPLPAGTRTTGGRLTLARPDHYPLRTDHDADPLRALLGAAAGLASGQHAAVQILARPVTGRRLRRARAAAAALRGGAPSGGKARLFDLITPTPPPQHATGSARDHPERAAEVKAILDKASRPRWAVEVRYAAATRHTGPGARRWLRGQAHALASAFALHTGNNHLTRTRLRRPGAALAGRRLGLGQLLSVPELAGLAHLPLDQAVPGLARAGARPVPPPPGIPAGGPAVKTLGDADAGQVRPVGVGVADARQHLHILGATGSGKSTLLANLILDDVAAGRGAVVIDPKGDLVTDLLPRLPGEAADRVALFDPDDAGPPPTLNPLEGPDRAATVDTLVGIFHRIFAAWWGPRTDDVLRSAALTLTATRGAATLADIPKLLTDSPYRRRRTGEVDDPILRGFWEWYEGQSEAARAQVIGPVMNKLRAFLLRDFVRATVAARSSVDMGRLLDHGGLCLVRVPKGALGEETARLLGSFVLAKVWQAATHRARATQRDRPDAAVYLDECHNFLTLPQGIEDLLAEARAYRLSLTLAHQHLAQLPRDLRDGVSANARNKVVFAASPEDAKTLERHTTPNLTAHDLAHLDAYQAGARLIISSAETPAFTLRSRPLPAAVSGRARQIRRAARAAHGATAIPAARRRGDPRTRRPAGGGQ